MSHACLDQSPTSCVSDGIRRRAVTFPTFPGQLSSWRPTRAPFARQIMPPASANGHARFVLPRCSNRAVRPTEAPTTAVVGRVAACAAMYYRASSGSLPQGVLFSELERDASSSSIYHSSGHRPRRRRNCVAPRPLFYVSRKSQHSNHYQYQ